jgi:hypothetical protein
MPEDALSGWFGADEPQPDRCVIIASRHLQPIVWEPHRRYPGVEQLPIFLPTARGLDHLHRLNTAHCDVKPANVARHATGIAASYVFIDSDSVAAVDVPVPCAWLRTTPQWTHPAFRLRLAEGGVVPPAELRAHDRFGFVLVVLVAVAGAAWVYEVLRLGRDQDVRAEVWTWAQHQPAAASAALHAVWDSPQAADLVTTLVQPLDWAVLLDPGWSAEAWIDRLMWTVRERPRLTFSPLTQRFRPHLEAIRARSADEVKGGYDAADVARAQAQAQGRRLAERRARMAFGLASLLAVSFVLMLFAVVSTLGR